MKPVRKLITLLLAVSLLAAMLPMTVGASGGTPGNLRVLDVDAYVADSVVNTSAGWDISSVTLPDDYDAYVINNGTASKPYLVNIDTIRFLTTVTVTGTGYVKWKDYLVRKEQCGINYAHTGVIPVSKLSDPIYMEMVLPTDGNYYWCDFSMDNSGPRRGGNLKWNNRKNGFNMVQPREDHLNMINMGAFYLNYDEEPPALNDSITICIRDMKMYVHKQGDAADNWILMSNRPKPTAGQVGNKVKISWSGGNINIQNRWSDAGDHIELALTGADLWTGDDDWQDNANHQYLIHFWDSQITFASIGVDPEEVDGIVCSYVAWVKEPEQANKLLATVGADVRPGLWPENYEDWQAVLAGTLTKNPYKPTGASRDSLGDTTWNGSTTNQVVASRGAAIPATPTVVYCHNVYPSIYDSVMDTEYMQNLLGISNVLDVDAYVADSVVNTTAGWDVSSITLPDGYDEYVINYGTAAKPYLFNTESIRTLANATVSGTGYAKWAGYNLRKEHCGLAFAQNGVIPASKFSDPVYLEMMLPSDGDFYWCDLTMNSSGPRRGGSLKWNNRKNGYNMVLPRSGHTSMVNVGALYLNYGETPPALTDTITLCIKDMEMYVHKQGDAADYWRTMSSTAKPTAAQIAHKVKISWASSSNIYSQWSDAGDHVELALTGADLWTGDTDWQDNTNHQYFINIWDSQINFSSVGISDPSQVDGIVCSYTAWIKEPGMANKLVATVGATLRPGLWPEKFDDWQAVQAGTLTMNPYKPANTSATPLGDATWNGTSTNSAVASRAVALGATPTVVFCHTVYPGIYDSVMDTDTIQTLLGMN